MNTYYAQRMNFGPKFVFGDESSVCVFSGVGDVSPKRFSKMELLFFYLTSLICMIYNYYFLGVRFFSHLFILHTSLTYITHELREKNYLLVQSK